MRTSSYLLMVLALLMSACGSESQAVPDAQAEASGAVDAAPAALSGDVLVEEHAGGSITWMIAGDGEVKALVEVASKPVKSDVSGSLVWGGAKKDVPLALDAKTGLLVAAGPKLNADLTQISYTINVSGKPWSGVLHMPRGGTAELVASAKASVKAGFEGKLGPHGGMIQVVGPDIFEIVAIEGTGELRVYLLDADLELDAIGERRITVAVEADVGAPKVAVMVPEPELGLYASAKVKLKADPLRITLAVKHGAKVSVALVGFKPGLKLKVGVKAPRIKIHVKAKAVADFDAKLKVKLKAKLKAKLKVKGPDIDVNAKLKAPKVKVDKKASASAESGSGSAKAKAKAGVKIGF